MLTQERLKELLDYDPETGVFVWKINKGRIKAGTPTGYRHSGGYLRIKINYVHYFAHRLAWLYMYGYWPKHEIDHINRIRNDNRINNLRAVTRQENRLNTSKSVANTSGYVGVTWHKQNRYWAAQITIRGKHMHLGGFDTPEEAHLVYAKAKEELHIIGEQQ